MSCHAVVPGVSVGANLKVVRAVGLRGRPPAGHRRCLWRLIKTGALWHRERVSWREPQGGGAWRTLRDVDICCGDALDGGALTVG